MHEIKPHTHHNIIFLCNSYFSFLTSPSSSENLNSLLSLDLSWHFFWEDQKCKVDFLLRDIRIWREVRERFHVQFKFEKCSHSKDLQYKWQKYFSPETCNLCFGWSSKTILITLSLYFLSFSLLPFIVVLKRRLFTGDFYFQSVLNLFKWGHYTATFNTKLFKVLCPTDKGDHSYIFIGQRLKPSLLIGQGDKCAK